MKNFIYRPSYQLIHWGTSFDSLLELKYAISVHPDYMFLRAQVPIWYDPRTKYPVNRIRGNSRRYTPDFLIRHKQNGNAFLTEIKPRAFSDFDWLAEKKEIAEKYIRRRGWDWVFQTVFDDEIQLNAEQQQQFLTCCRLKGSAASVSSIHSMEYSSEETLPIFFQRVPSSAEVHFVMYGC